MDKFPCLNQNRSYHGGLAQGGKAAECDDVGMDSVNSQRAESYRFLNFISENLAREGRTQLSGVNEASVAHLTARLQIPVNPQVKCATMDLRKINQIQTYAEDIEQIGYAVTLPFLASST